MGLSEDSVLNATLLRSVIFIFPPIKTEYCSRSGWGPRQMKLTCTSLNTAALDVRGSVQVALIRMQASYRHIVKTSSIHERCWWPCHRPMSLTVVVHRNNQQSVVLHLLMIQDPGEIKQKMKQKAEKLSNIIGSEKSRQCGEQV